MLKLARKGSACCVAQVSRANSSIMKVAKSILQFRCVSIQRFPAFRHRSAEGYEAGGRENNVSLDDVTCHPHRSLTKGDSNYSVSLCSTIRARSLAERGESDALAHMLQLVPG